MPCRQKNERVTVAIFILLCWMIHAVAHADTRNSQLYQCASGRYLIDLSHSDLERGILKFPRLFEIGSGLEHAVDRSGDQVTWFSTDSDLTIQFEAQTAVGIGPDYILNLNKNQRPSFSARLDPLSSERITSTCSSVATRPQVPYDGIFNYLTCQANTDLQLQMNVPEIRLIVNKFKRGEWARIKEYTGEVEYRGKYDTLSKTLKRVQLGPFILTGSVESQIPKDIRPHSSEIPWSLSINENAELFLYMKKKDFDAKAGSQLRLQTVRFQKDRMGLYTGTPRRSSLDCRVGD